MFSRCVKTSQIDNLEIAKQAMTLLEKENETLHKRLKSILTENAELRGEDASKRLQEELSILKAQAAAMQKKIFGRSSERRKGEEKGKEKGKEKPDKPKRDSKAKQVDLPIVEVEHSLRDDEKTCDGCGGELKEWIGKFEEYEEIDVVERDFRILRHKRKKYRCACGCAPVTTPGPPRLRGSKYSLAFAVATVVDKWGMHLPHVRQSQQMALQGCGISDAQLWQVAENLARVLQGTYEVLGEQVAEAELIHADETTWPMLRKGSKKWWAWTFSSYDKVFICIDESRGHQVPKKILQDSSAVLVVDGFSAYETLVRSVPSLRIALCWSHARRKFIEAEKAFPQATEMIDLMRELFMIERELDDFRECVDDAERAKRLANILEVRDAKSRPIIEDIRNWMTHQETLPKSRLAGAIKYLSRNWSKFCVFLDEPHVPLTNNQAERTVRPCVLGRKNHLGSKSRRGTEVAALFYSLIGSCRMIGVDPTAYLAAATHTALANPGDVLLPTDFKSMLAT